MPINKQDSEAQARQIALDIGSRRRAGEVITDAQVLRAYPKLREPLAEQLEQLSRLEATHIPAGDAGDPAQPVPEVVCTDFQGTLDLPMFAEEVAPGDPDLRRSPEGPPPDLPGSSAQAPAPPAAAKVAAASDVAPPAAWPGKHSAPDTDTPGGEDQLRITLREPGANNAQQSTLVVGDTGVSEPGMALSVPPRYRPTVRPPMAVIKLFHDGQTTFNQYPIFGDRFRIGRLDGDLVVPHDFWMSGRHAEIQRHKRGDRYHWMLVDLNSTNGTFVQTDFTVLRHNDELFLGQERYRFILQDGQASLMHVTRGAGQQWHIQESGVHVGSQLPCGLKIFADDPYLDRVHARIAKEPDGNWAIRDKGSQNGVWFRIKEVELPPDCEFQLGEQRFGFWTHADHSINATDLHVASKSSHGGQ